MLGTVQTRSNKCSLSWKNVWHVWKRWRRGRLKNELAAERCFFRAWGTKGLNSAVKVPVK